MRTTRKFQLFKAQDNVASVPSFDGRATFDEHYADIKDKQDKGLLGRGDPYPDDLEKMKADCVASEERRLGRKLTPDERTYLVEDDDEN